MEHGLVDCRRGAPDRGVARWRCAVYYRDDVRRHRETLTLRTERNDRRMCHSYRMHFCHVYTVGWWVGMGRCGVCVVRRRGHLDTPEALVVALALFFNRLLVRLWQGADDAGGVAAPDGHGGDDCAVGEHGVGEDEGEVFDDDEFALRVASASWRRRRRVGRRPGPGEQPRCPSPPAPLRGAHVVLTTTALAPISTPCPILAASTIASGPIWT